MKSAMLLLILAGLCLAYPASGADRSTTEWDPNLPLPRWELGRTRSWDPASMYKSPYALTSGFRVTPGSGVIKPPPEYEPCEGLLLRWDGYWKQFCIDFINAAADASNDSVAYLVCQSSMVSSVRGILAGNGVDVSQVIFVPYLTESIWIRDYGPHFIWHDDTRAVVDSHYYSQRPRDNSVPVEVAEVMTMPLYDIPMMYSGGNFLCTNNRHAYLSDIILDDNPNLDETKISELYGKYQGVDTMHVFPAFPANIDATGHIDMWMAILSDTKVIIGEYTHANPSYPAIVITENAVTYMENLGFTVYRTPAYNSGGNGYNGTHFTYTNYAILNNKAIIPMYGGTHATDDAAALAVFQAALPGYTIEQVDSLSIIPSAGTLHCTCMHVPRYADSEPAIKVVEPDGGELWAGSTPCDIRWAADDDEGVTAVDLYCSHDNGVTFPHAIALGEAHDGVLEGWTPPWENAKRCLIKAVAHDSALNQGEDASNASYVTDYLKTQHYDFSSGAGVDKWAYGHYTDGWGQDLAFNKTPVECSTPVDQIQADAYDRLAYSDATGGDTDPNRFINTKPGTGNESTLIAVFNIQEARSHVRSLEFLYEGYAEDTQHLEIYIWNYVKGNWSNGKDKVGQNNFWNNGSHLTDRIYRSATVDAARDCVSAQGEVTVLIYNDTANFQTFHDYMRLTVLSKPYEAKGNIF